MPSPKPLPLLIARSLRKLILAGFLLLTIASSAAAFDGSQTFAPHTYAVSFEGALVRYQSGRLAGAYLNAWNVGARISWLPFGVSHSRFMHGYLDGALELGLEPTFQRFNSVHQNFAGLLVKGRYHLLGLKYGRLVPWVSAGIGPGYSDLNIGRVANDTKLEGPFMALIMGEGGLEYFASEQSAIYVGIQGQHVSNAGLNGQATANFFGNRINSSTNVSLNTPWGLVMGFTWFFK
jgi:hypothetical protein